MRVTAKFINATRATLALSAANAMRMMTNEPCN